MARSMAPLRIPAALVSLVLVLSACADASDGAGSEVTRALLPAAETAAPEPATTTTSQPSLSPTEADQLARTQVRAVLAAAEEIFAERGTYDADLGTVSELAAGVNVVALEQAALHDAVAYDSHDQRLTLHRQSASGRWFCIDVTDAGEDHGVGDSFEQALESCTDGLQAGGWGDVFSPTGSDEAAISALLRALAGAVAGGDGAAAHATFDQQTSCSLAELHAVWPDGVALAANDDEFELEHISVVGERATAVVSFGPVSDTAWPLVKRGSKWFNNSDPCRRFGEVATDRAVAAARETLERGLFAVRSIYVARTTFSFAPRVLAELDADLVLVPSEEITFGTLVYQGTPTEGLLITAADPDRFYCAVESTFATTVYGEGSAIGEVDTVAKCKSHATP